MPRVRPILATLALAAAAFSACSRPPSTMEVEFIPSPIPGAVFASAVRVGNLLFLSGQIGTDSTGRLVPGGLQAEARQALNNIQGVLEKNGSSLDRVVKCTVFLADMKDYNDFNEIYATYFRARKPARSAFGATGLARNARLEIECIAVTG
jgi:reactive intermediate/imine deaminase